MYVSILYYRLKMQIGWQRGQAAVAARQGFGVGVSRMQIECDDDDESTTNGTTAVESAWFKAIKDDDIDEVYLGWRSLSTPLQVRRLIGSVADSDECLATLLNQRDESASALTRGATALHWLADRGNVRIVQLLLSFPPRVVDVNVRDDATQSTPLHYAVAAEQADVCRLLLQYPTIDATIANADGETARQMAVANGGDVADAFKNGGEALDDVG